jgi:electron transport complex protein RnfB
MNPVDAIDALLPQTQCTKCGYAGCRPYAQAVADNLADINQCPPGGQRGVGRLAGLLQREVLPLNPEHGVEQPPTAACVVESQCIGCTLCIQACPTDAIMGAAKRMHSVVTEWCSGCELCLPVCPVDCIVLIPLEELSRCGDAGAIKLLGLDDDQLRDLWRSRHHERNARRTLERERRDQRMERKAIEKLAGLEGQKVSGEITRKKATIEAALERARKRRVPEAPAR